jgi:hypothetical protein
MKIALYIYAKISMRPMWENMFNIAKRQQVKNNLKTFGQNIEMDTKQDPLEKFEEKFENVTIDNLMQIFLSTNQIMNDENVITMGPSQDYKSLRPFKDPNNKECNYPTLFFGMLKKPSILARFQYQDIAQWELMHNEHHFATHIPDLFF